MQYHSQQKLCKVRIILSTKLDDLSSRWVSCKLFWLDEATSSALSRSDNSSGSCKTNEELAIKKLLLVSPKGQQCHVACASAHRELLCLCRPITDSKRMLKILLSVHEWGQLGPQALCGQDADALRWLLSYFLLILMSCSLLWLQVM